MHLFSLLKFNYTFLQRKRFTKKDFQNDSGQMASANQNAASKHLFETSSKTDKVENFQLTFNAPKSPAIDVFKHAMGQYISWTSIWIKFCNIDACGTLLHGLSLILLSAIHWIELF